ncbi:peptidoglycan recognition protein family protein [Streptomyces tsukubensis]|uniref:N-acetylmuramoyl-L-alanine amidase n=1 Tax=Streptomyces tsukubensis TaxID=83656 RepID=A0A1V4A1T0_9ACTN|nr:peptidoglycan recognition protein [Streptomyces tsukubensis]OON73039.1 N-acetylmuramoyl-L-alanine amidase [Streptomyces tsukubensis]QFR93952.1 N-acetylmuramoyl-L-alanine amidase [Streptomyces tsukubensis]
MRGFLASSIGVTCAAALAVPLAFPSGARTTARAATDRSVSEESADIVPGATRSLRMAPLPGDRAGGASSAEGTARREVRPFSLVGVVWDDAEKELHGRVQVRTRATGGGAWSGWQDLETHNAEHAADRDTPEGARGAAHGSTAPLWVGPSDAVESRVTPERAGGEGEAAGRAGAKRTGTGLPAGLRLDLVDPGEGSAAGAGGASGMEGASGAEGAEGMEAASGTEGAEGPEGAGGPAAPLGTLSADGDRAGAAPVRSHTGPRPAIVTRKRWGANERLREKKFRYTRTVKAAFVHHTATGNSYTCAQAPSVIRGIYRYHVKSMGWRDIGYNFLIDKCGKIYEGRAGGVTKPVMGAHTLGFNTNSTGIAVIGTYSRAKPPAAAVKGVARLTAWKLGLTGANPKRKVTLVSGGSNRYHKGKKVRMNVISGHRDGFSTECPGARLYKKLGTVRSTAAKRQHR